MLLLPRCQPCESSCPSRGTWIEIFFAPPLNTIVFCRAPRGARGLKSHLNEYLLCGECRAPRGARGLKSDGAAAAALCGGRAPLGARGLKSSEMIVDVAPVRSCPSRGTWIEIDMHGGYIIY